MSEMQKIPKTILQSSNEIVQQYVIGLLAGKCLGWEYIHFNDEDIITFFKENPLEEFPLITEQFNKIKKGAHKSDLFRYYYLYINGGFHIDSDAKIQADIETIVKTYDFVSVYSSFEGTLFQGIIGSTPKHPIIYEALKHAYSVDVNTLEKDYFLFCREIYDIIHNRDVVYENIKLYKEFKDEHNVVANTYNIEIKDGKEVKELLFTHYYHHKVIPFPYNYPKTVAETKIGITFTVPNVAMDIFTNGIKQNVLYVYDLLKNIGYDVYFFVTDKDYEIVKNANFWNIPGKYKYIKMNDMCTQPMHLVIQMGFQLSGKEIFFFKECGAKTVFYVCGNKYIIDGESCLYRPQDNYDFQYNEMRSIRFDEIWLIPQHTNSCTHYFKTLFRAKTIEVPFIWSPFVMENYEKELGKPIQYVNRGVQKSIATFEPNLSLMKWSLPALLVCENAHRTLRDNSLIKYIYATNIVETSNKSFNSKLFNNMVKSLDIFTSKKLSIEARYNSLYFMSKYSDIAVSFQTENNLNYLYLDLAWMGWPIVHNANLCKDVGYYYDGYNYEEGGQVLKNVILTHDENVAKYTEKNRKVIDRYLPTNKKLQKAYKKLIDNLLKC
jgi:mannosyltransferase OCH1-like enzyme